MEPPAASMLPSIQHVLENNQPSKRRKKNPEDGSRPQPEPRRLRRSHEACARCRSKKIKVPSTFTCAFTSFADFASINLVVSAIPSIPDVRLAQAQIQHAIKKIAIAKQRSLEVRRIPNFDLGNLDELCAAEGIVIPELHPAGMPAATVPMPPYPADPTKGPTFVYQPLPPGQMAYIAYPPPGAFPAGQPVSGAPFPQLAYPSFPPGAAYPFPPYPAPPPGYFSYPGPVQSGQPQAEGQPSAVALAPVPDSSTETLSAPENSAQSSASSNDNSQTLVTSPAVSEPTTSVISHLENGMEFCPSHCALESNISSGGKSPVSRNEQTQEVSTDNLS
ncbi:hypothetical protein FISHEDRAFT_78429 [Fistulina hepatica ATCC 64428]|nr:hypothetical protein FISHEDRAFT_78429 [Fistulina hepatica ATCC 64428]